MILHRRHFLAGGAALAGLAPLSALAQEDGSALQSLLKDSGAPALTGAVVTPAGLQAVVAAGVRRVGSSDLVGRNDLWHIGSNTKAMTAALYARYVDGGRATWGATLPALFGDLNLDPAWSSVTIENLLWHRSGISDRPVMGDGWLDMAQADRRPLRDQRTELASSVLGKPPAGVVGKFEYSNVGYILAGAAIERLTGQVWEDAITADLFGPLGMASAGFGAPIGPNPWGHAKVGGGLRAIDPTGLADNPPALGPAGRVRLAMADYARFAQLFLTDGGGFLSVDAMTRLTTPAIGDGAPYAMGWGVTSADWGQGPVLAHEGSNTLWHAVALVAPKRGVAILTACNAGPEASKRAAMTLALKLREAYAAG
jgi:D-alanyl-D-alanine carboxypeptidase